MFEKYLSWLLRKHIAARDSNSLTFSETRSLFTNGIAAHRDGVSLSGLATLTSASGQALALMRSCSAA